MTGWPHPLATPASTWSTNGFVTEVSERRTKKQGKTFRFRFASMLTSQHSPGRFRSRRIDAKKCHKLNRKLFSLDLCL